MYVHREEFANQGVDFPVLADLDHSLAAKFGCLLPKVGVALRATYIIDAQGVLRHSSTNDLEIERDFSLTLNMVRRCQSSYLNDVVSETFGDD